MTFWANARRELFLLPNFLSLLRIFCGFFIPFLILQENFWIHAATAVLYTFAAMTDYWDGMLARKRNLVSDTGKILDPLADKALILGCYAAFVARGYYGLWWVVPIFAREIIVTFCRFAWLYEGTAVGAEKLGKIKLCLQVTAVSFSLLYLLTDETGAAGTVWSLMQFFMMASSILTVVSGATFLMHNARFLKGPVFAKFTAALGVGLLPRAPGTWGSVLGVCLAVLASVDWLVYALTFLFLFAAGGWAFSRLPAADGKDPSYVVVDEACGIFITLMLLPLNPVVVLFGFLFFRLFDIWKPFPLRKLEKLPGYWGVMADDLAAGLYAWILTFLIFV